MMRNYSILKFLLLQLILLYQAQPMWGEYNFPSTEMQQHFFVESNSRNTTTLTDIDAQLIVGFFSLVVWGDYDNDGWLDILISGSLFAFKHTFTVTSTGEIIDGRLPSEFYLFQNYPNPFSPSTTINFTLAKQSVVSLKVCNLLGQEVATLINNEELGKGDHSIDFVADGSSCCVYFY